MRTLLALKPRYHASFVTVGVAALLFAETVSLTLILRLAVLYLSFNVLLYGGIYTFNGIADRAADARHPMKRWRPIASGRLDVRAAAAIAATLCAAGVVVGALLLPVAILPCDAGPPPGRRSHTDRPCWTTIVRRASVRTYSHNAAAVAKKPGMSSQESPAIPWRQSDAKRIAAVEGATCSNASADRNIQRNSACDATTSAAVRTGLIREAERMAQSVHTYSARPHRRARNRMRWARKKQIRGWRMRCASRSGFRKLWPQ